MTGGPSGESLGGPRLLSFVQRTPTTELAQHSVVHARVGRRSQMNESCGVANGPPCGALLPVTDAGNTIAVIAEPGTVVPGAPSQSSPTVQPPTCVPFGFPMRARPSVNNAAPPPAGCTLYLIWFGGTVT